MSNKYLEKIAGSGVISSVGKAVLSVGKGIAQDVGNSFMTAGGAGFRNAAHTLDPGLSQKTLRSAGNARGFMKATRGLGVSRQTIKDLQADKTKGIVKSVGYGSAALYGGNKIINKIKENNQSQPQYY